MISSAIAFLLLGLAPQWTEGDPDRLIRTGLERPLMVYVHASWCGPCNQLETDALSSPLMSKRLENVGGVMVDFDSPVGQRITSKYRVLSLPTVLVLDTSGVERGRVEGYAGLDEFFTALDGVFSDPATLEVLQRRVADAPGDLSAQLDLAKRHLAAGNVDTARKSLFALVEKEGTIGGHAARAWGRYLVRVKRDSRAGSAHYEAMERRFRGTDFRPEFLYWHAQALMLAGRRAAALERFDTWAIEDPRGMQPLLYKASFMTRHQLPAKDIVNVLIIALSLDDSDAHAHYLMADARLRLNDPKSAMSAIRRAIKLKPKRAVYRNFARKRLGMLMK